MDEDPSGVTSIYNPNDPAAGLWQVNLADDETQAMSALELSALLARGTLNPHDTYVWREGMADWLPMLQCPDLMNAVHDYERRAAAARASQPQRSVMPTLRPAAPFAPAPSARGELRLPSPLPPPHAPTLRPSAPQTQVSPSHPGHHAPPPSAPPSYAPATPNPAAVLPVHYAQGPASVPSQPGYGIVAPPMSVPLSQPQSAVSSLHPIAAAQLAVEPKRDKSSLGLVLGAAAAMVLLTGAGVLWVVLSARPDEAPVASRDVAVESRAAVAASTAAEPSAEEKDEPAPEPSAATSASAAPVESAAPEPPPVETATAKEDAKTKVASNESAKGDAATTSKAKSEASDDKKKKDEKKKDDKKKDDKPAAAGEFNVGAAKAALGSAAAAASGCGQSGGPTGKGRADVTFSPSGKVQQVSISAPFSGTPVGSCVKGAFKGASVPPFSGGAMTATKSFTVR